MKRWSHAHEAHVKRSNSFLNTNKRYDRATGRGDGETRQDSSILAMRTRQFDSPDIDSSENTSTFANVEAFRGIFSDGYTDQDINSVLPKLSAIFETDVVAIWDHFDDYGFGGDSSIYVATDKNWSTLIELSAEWISFLIHGEGLPSLSRLTDKYSDLVDPSLDLNKEDGSNFAFSLVE